VSTDTTDVLGSIDDILKAWEGSSDAAVHDNRAGFPPLDDIEMEIAARLCADTGIDGYAAAYAIADVRDYGEGSPYYDLVMPPVEAVFEGRCPHCSGPDHAPVVTEIITVDTSRAVQAIAEIQAAIIRAAGVTAEEAAEIGQDILRMGHLGYAAWPGHRRAKCHRCNPYGNPPKLAIDGHKYNQRRNARRRRGR